MIKTAPLVPRRDNAGQAFGREDWQSLEDRLFERFGGFTREQYVAGAWRAGDRVYRDASRRYTVAIGGWMQLPAWLEIVRWRLEYLRQEAIYFEVAGVPEIVAGDLG